MSWYVQFAVGVSNMYRVTMLAIVPPRVVGRSWGEWWGMVVMMPGAGVESIFRFQGSSKAGRGTSENRLPQAK